MCNNFDRFWNRFDCILLAVLCLAARRRKNTNSTTRCLTRPSPPPPTLSLLRLLLLPKHLVLQTFHRLCASRLLLYKRATFDDCDTECMLRLSLNKLARTYSLTFLLRHTNPCRNGVRTYSYVLIAAGHARMFSVMVESFVCFGVHDSLLWRSILSCQV